jgi:hypothetical protein
LASNIMDYRHEDEEIPSRYYRFSQMWSHTERITFVFPAVNSRQPQTPRLTRCRTDRPIHDRGFTKIIKLFQATILPMRDYGGFTSAEYIWLQLDQSTPAPKRA